MPQSDNGKPIVSLHRKPRVQQPTERAPGPPPFPGRRFHLPMKYPRDAFVDLDSGFSRPRFAEQMARMIWVDHHDGVGFKSHGSVGSAMEALRRFEDYLKHADAAGRIQTIRDVAASDIDGFDDWAHARWPEGSVVPFTHLTTLIQLFRSGLEHRFADPRLAPRLDYVSNAHARVECTPRDAYSPYVMQQIRDGARTAVLATARRMAGVRRLPALPRSKRRLSSVDELLVHLRDRGFIADHDEIGRVLRWFESKLTPAQLLDRIHPGLPDLAPFAILIADDCGLPPECIQELGADCLEESDGEHGVGFLHYTKRRRGSGGEAEPEPVGTKDDWSTGWLVKLLLELTETTRQQMRPEDGAERLFVGRVGTKLKSLLVNTYALEAHLRRHPVIDEAGVRITGIELSRIRKTVKAGRYAEAGGDLERIGKDHTKRVFATNYGVVKALEGTHDAAIASALTAGLADALSTTVLTPESERRMAADPAAAAVRLGTDTAKLGRVLEGSSDVWLAGCLDFTNSPYAGSQGCGAPFWGCVDCRNAVITKAKLPALLRLLEHLLGKRQEMTLAAFARAFGFVFTRVQQIIDRFDAADIEAALEEVKDEIGPDWSLAQLTYVV